MELNGLNDCNGPEPELADPSGNAAACVAWYARIIEPVEFEPFEPLESVDLEPDLLLELLDPLLLLGCINAADKNALASAT
jgi:hypothetical protein